MMKMYFFTMVLKEKLFQFIVYVLEVKPLIFWHYAINMFWPITSVDLWIEP